MKQSLRFGLIAIVIIIICLFVATSVKPKTSKPVACTLEAMQCPDGSYVGRTGPRCEFSACPTTTTTFDPKNASYSIDGQIFTLKNGSVQTEAAPGSASKVTTSYFGNEATGDLNSDGVNDTAFLITQDMGGTGVFYYVVASIASTTGFKTTNAFLIGDRIAPQTTEIKNGQLLVNFADRNPGEPMSATPSVGVTTYLKVDGRGNLVKAQQ